MLAGSLVGFTYLILTLHPFVALDRVREAISSSNIKLAAQNMYFEDSGAFTGEISPKMLKN